MLIVLMAEHASKPESLISNIYFIVFIDPRCIGKTWNNQGKLKHFILKIFKVLKSWSNFLLSNCPCYLTKKLVKPEKASAVEAMIVSAATSGKIVSRINEGKLIEMLEGIGAKKRQPATINIQRKKYAFDSDDEEDNDDDLL